MSHGRCRSNASMDPWLSLQPIIGSDCSVYLSPPSGLHSHPAHVHITLSGSHRRDVRRIPTVGAITCRIAHSAPHVILYVLAVCRWQASSPNATERSLRALISAAHAVAFAAPRLRFAAMVPVAGRRGHSRGSETFLLSFPAALGRPHQDPRSWTAVQRDLDRRCNDTKPDHGHHQLHHRRVHAVCIHSSRPA